jgi:hypothetical protein
MDHDPLCQWANTPTHRDRAASCPRCALIARVRAGEEAQAAKVHREILGRYIAHAEEVAARLVEVICEQEREWENAMQWQEESNEQWIETLDKTRAERDAARAEAAELQASVAEYKDALYRCQTKGAAPEYVRDWYRSEKDGSHG